MTRAWAFLLLLLLTLAVVAEPADFGHALTQAALERTRHSVTYDGAYRAIAYPNGDVPANVGVCTDVVVRVYRALGFDLQQAVHEDMQRAFQAYPSQRIWGLARPDSNIDHRRVPNLQTFFRRHGKTLPLAMDRRDYRAGDIVTWMLPGNLPHIGLVIALFAEDGETPLIVHNIGRGPVAENVLFSYPITGHFRFQPDIHQSSASATAAQ